MGRDWRSGGAIGQPPEERRLETDRTATGPRLCEGCGADLTPRRPQARWCSNRCRAEGGRKRHAGRIRHLIGQIEDLFADLKAEIDGGAE
jgi:hypothetical protein